VAALRLHSVAVRSLVFSICLAVTACAGSAAPPVRSSADNQLSASASGRSDNPVPSSARAGTSDGVTCEQARAQYNEEIDPGARGPADLTANDFGAVLNEGGYLTPCEVPAASHLDLCVAVQNGSAVGVTVTADPAAPDVELCVARQVRGLVFPAHPKMDIAKVHF